MRACSRKRPTMLFTRIFSDTPGTPGRRQQMPRTTRSICTPAWEARYRFSMISESRSEEHSSELQSLMRISYAVFCLKKKNNKELVNGPLQHGQYKLRVH